MSNTGVQAISTTPILDPLVKVGAGLSSPLASTSGSPKSTTGVTPLPFQTYHAGELKPLSGAGVPETTGSGSSAAPSATGKEHAPLVQELKPIDLTPPAEMNVGYSVSKDGKSIQVKMTNSSTGEVVRSFDIKAADLANVSKTNIAIKGSQIDAQS